MYIVLGGTGHVGSSVADTLLDREQPVTILSNDDAKRAEWEAKGASFEIVDVNDSAALQQAFRLATRAFLLNPPADTAGDTDMTERATVANIVAALAGSNLEKVVVESSIWARPGDRLGDNNTLWALEAGVAQTGIPTAINRAPFYMTNWDAALEPIRATGVFETIYPADIRLPCGDPVDLGRIGAERLMSDVGDIGIRFIEGPGRYSSTDFADAFARALGRDVELRIVPPDEWEAYFLANGFSAEAAYSYKRMSDLAVFDAFTIIQDPIIGEITLDQHIRALVDRA